MSGEKGTVKKGSFCFYGSCFNRCNCFVVLLKSAPFSLTSRNPIKVLKSFIFLYLMREIQINLHLLISKRRSRREGDGEHPEAFTLHGLHCTLVIECVYFEDVCFFWAKSTIFMEQILCSNKRRIV